MADNKKSVNLLPEYLKTDKNSKFLSGTLDPLIQSPQLERIDGFVGSKITPNYNPTTDFYLKEDLALRKEYPLEPALIFKDQSANITDVVAFDDIINELSIQGGKTDNLDTLFRSKFYSYDPYIEWDKLVNYNQYFWLPTGPDAIILDGTGPDAPDLFDITFVGDATYTMPNGYALSNGMKIRFGVNVTPSSYSDTEYYVEGVGSSINLIAVKLLEVNEKVAGVYNETFDSDSFDTYGFDSNKRIPITPEYITINRASDDLNPWSRYNRWFHGEIIRITAAINQSTSTPAFVYPLDARAKRPVIEFKSNIQLYNFGNLGIENIDVIDLDTTDAFATVDGSIGYYVDGILLEQGNRVVFNADPLISGIIYEVDYDVANNPPILRLIAVHTATTLESVAVNYGVINQGTSWHYDVSTNTWIKSQQHTVINQAPLFDLFDSNEISYGNRTPGSSSFIGSKIFGYDVGTGANDSVLGFPLKYQNSIGVGSYLFKNYFMTDVISITDANTVSSNKTTGITYLQVNNNLASVWAPTVDFQIPIVEIQTMATATNVITLTSIFTTATSVIASVNSTIVKSILEADGVTVTIDSATTVNINDLVSLEITSTGTPNANGFYKTPLGLTNNPLNGPISDMTLSELSDHLSTMVNHTAGFTGVFPGNGNLRDLTDYTKYGTRLIVNANPIAFAEIFLGKKEHNVVDALRLAADQYNQFKMNLLRSIVTISGQLTAADALDSVLKEINTNRDSHSPYYNSDMLAYGSDKIVREYTVTGPSNIFSIGVEFDLSKLSFQSVLVYLNNEQLVYGADYYFDAIDGRIVISKTLTVGDVVSIHYYSNTVGSFVPSTPSKLGMFPKFEPAMYDDDSYIGGAVTVIRGHDGSIMKAYNDYRDAIILEFEKRVYNNIKITYDPAIFDVAASMPGAFREDKYLLSDATSILTKDFIKWTGVYNIDATTNDIYDEGNPFTWNYVNTVDTLLGKSVPGYWRGIYKYFYDTDRPHSHPWEMLGFSSEPTWWEDEYGAAPYLSTNAMWADLETGTVMDPALSYVLASYARPGLSEIIPVDISGNLKNPSSFLVSETSYTDKISNWKFGDQSPAETAWRRSSYWPFSNNVAAALLDPCSYSSTMYDLSRTALNPLGQITYTEDDLYLNPSKLLIDGEVQTAGFGVYVVEKGTQKNLNYVASLKQDLAYIDFNLFHKLGGFASKDKLQVVIDSIDPVSSSQGAVLPPEDYSLILNTSNPIKSASISGIIVQKSGGKFIIKGYDKTNPYFEILKPIGSSASGAITIGGKSSSFTEWTGVVNNGNSGLSAIDITSTSANTSHYYKQGQIVRYNGTYYVVKISHTTQPTFDLTYFQALPSLPMTGGATAQLPARFESAVTKVSYGTSFSTIQDVYDVIVGYGAYLESQGFIFDEFNTDLNDIVDWSFTGKEFLFWTTQNWADGNLITLSPFADYLKYTFIDSIVDNISTGKYEYSLLKADGKSFPIDKFRLSREDGVCIINTIDTLDGMFFATLNSVQKEHGMVFNNSTIFNDTIYDIETGYKQRRIKLSGFRTANWNGDLYSPGFVYDSIDISDWTAFGLYLPGKVVRYNGAYYESNVKISNDATFDFNKWTKLDGKPVSNLLPNFDYKINQFEDFYSLDIDNFDATQQQLAQHLVGYTPRTYLNNIFTNPISQYKFYQGFIKEKGTKNAIDKLAKVGKFTRQGEITFNEDWAFRVGNYGSFNTYKEIEFTLEESTALENPYLVKFANTVPVNANPLINYVTSSTLLLTPDDYNTVETFTTIAGTFADNNLVLTTAGYVRPDDVTATAYNKNSLLDIANNSLIQEGNTIWMGFLENGDWGISRYSKQSAKIAGVYVSSPAVDITFVTDTNHNLSVGEIVSIVRFNEQVDGIHIVTSIPSLDQFTVASELTTIVNADLLSYGALFKFENARYSSIEALANSNELLKLKVGEKLWVDAGVDDKWQVYEKIKNYSTGSTVYGTIDRVLNQHLGQSIYTSDDAVVVMVSAPGWQIPKVPTSNGSVWVYTKHKGTGVLDKQFEYALNDETLTYCELGVTSEFGHSLAYDNNKRFYVTGAPAASNVRGPSSTTGVVILSPGSGNVKSYAYEGLVKLSSNTALYAEVTEAVLVNPYATTSETASHARFGHSVFITQPAASALTTLLVSAPGDSINTGTGHVYAYSVNNAATITVHTSGINLNSHVALTNGSQFGHKIAGNASGSVVAISAPYYAGSGYTGIVQLFNSNLVWIQTIASPFGTNAAFGDDITVSADGSLIFVSSSNTKIEGESYGKVAVYTFDGTVATLHQIIDNPLRSNELRFGTALSVSKDNSTFAVSALGTNSTELLKFDVGSKEGETTFDGGITQFVNLLPDAGTVYVYNNLNGYFIISEELFDESMLTGSKYGSSIVATNNEVLIGAPAATVISSPTDDSRIYQFTKIDSTTNSWKVLRQQVDLTDVSTVDRVVLIDSDKEEIIEYLDVIDPVKGKIAGIAEQELKYKSAFDPATYTIGLAASIIDADTSWIDAHVGELWWDLSTTKYMWYEQGDDIYRKNSWGKLFPGSSIDVYEWVRSDLLPSEWAAQADTNEGLTNGISGQPKYPDNSVVSIKQLFNNVTNAFENVYFFWVKNKVTVPSTKNRRISSYQVSSIIADPVANGLQFVEILSTDSVAFANVQPLLVGSKINANIAIDTTNNEIPRHTEWLLLAEGDVNGMPTTLLEKKLVDSLLGHDSVGNAVPAIELTYRNRYGIGIRPQQSLFNNRIQALRNVVEFANSVLIKNRITGNYNFDTLKSQEPIPDTFSREYDLVVEDLDALYAIDSIKFAQAEVECFVSNGKIIGVDIISQGYGYTIPPIITIADNASAELLTEIDSDGRVVSVTISTAGTGYAIAPTLLVRAHTVIVRTNADYKGIWTKHQFEYATRKTDTDPASWWIRIKNQTYNTPLYWHTVNWVSESYNEFKDYSYVLEQVSDLSTVVDITPGEYVKINNVIEGSYYIVLERLSDTEIGNFSNSYNIVFSENGTIQILDSIWNYSSSNYSYDVATLDETLYDQIPDLELFYILLALKNDIFINDLKVNWNLFFFTAVKYALTEQKLLDWAFKTSFINVTNVIGELDQRSVYKLDDEKYFEDYIKEVKPYHSQIRTYTSNYTYLENANKLDTTDFDLPSYFDTATNQFSVVDLSNDLITQQPWKSWADNYTSSVGSIIVANAGTRYTQQPTVTITGGGPNVTSVATAEAYIRSGKVYKINILNAGAGYTQQPTVTITGGGPLVTSNATASASLLNSTTRKNTIGIKFDRVNAQSEIGEIRVTDTFTCPGNVDKFVLTWLAESNKLHIDPTLDGKLVLSSDYTIEYYSEEYNGYSKKYSKFVFLNYIPLEDQVFKISYNKSINLFTAVDRIENYYTATAVLSTLMTGTVFPGSVLQGLPFDYSTPWDTVQGAGRYDVNNSAWSELVNYYTTAKLVSTATAGSTTLYLNTTTNIVVGQVINILDSSAKRIRDDTVVTAVNTGSRSITISEPSFRILSAKSTATAIGSDILIKTTPAFNGGIVFGDQITITGLTPSEYNGSYIVSSILDADKFIVTATSILSTTASVSSPASFATVVTLLTTVDTNDVLLDHMIQTYEVENQSITVYLSIMFSNIGGMTIFKDGLPTPMLTGIPVVGPYPGGEYYQVTEGTNGHAVVTFYQMTNFTYNLEFFIYGYPTVEFWKPETMVSGLDSAISGGSWDSMRNFVGALGVAPEDIIIDGDSFLNVRSGYAPEELVAGHVIDSLGINVYTKAEDSHATVMSGAFPVIAGQITEATLSLPLDNFAGIMVNFNGKIFNKLSDSAIAQGPYFSSTPASAAGPVGEAIASNAGDDTFTGPYPLNMSWNMFGTLYTEVYVGTNGYLTFGGGNSEYTPLEISALNHPSILIEYCDLWQGYGLFGSPLSTGEIPGLYISTGIEGDFVYWRLRFQGTHYNVRESIPTVPAYEYEVTLYSNGTDQYVEMIYENTWRGVNVGVDTTPGFITGIATANAGSSYVEVPYTSILNNTSHVFYSTANGGNWNYAGQGKFTPVKNPFAFTNAYQYYMIGNVIHLAPQEVSGRAGYTVIGIGSDRSVLDNNMVVVENTTTAIVESLAIINDVRKAYVLVNGVEINEVSSIYDYGYMLTAVGENNKRAGVTVYNLDPNNPYTIAAWFFESDYTNFNRVHEEFYTINSVPESVFTLTLPPGIIEPVSAQVIVELGQPGTPLLRKRLVPPYISYYKIINNQVTFDIDNNTVHPQYTYSMDTVKVYANGVELRPGFDYTLDEVSSTITIASGLLVNGDVLAIEGLLDQEYVISGNILELTTPVSDTTLKIISFTDHDNMLIRTEQFDGNPTREFILAFPVLNDNYVWIYVNGTPLIARYDFEILDDLRTIQISDSISISNTDIILITTVNPPSYGSQILGFRVFNDMFDRHHFKRMSSFHSTTLAQPLTYIDTEIYVTDASKLIPPNPLTNRPGVVLIDGERIEYFVKDGNTLRQLRRSTLGTGPAVFSNAGTTVIDQSLQQDIPYVESTFVQTTSTTLLTYIINTATNEITGDGITLTAGVAAVDQINVYYGGRQLRKTSLVLHDKTKAYDTTATSIVVLPPEFTITTATNELVLNVSDSSVNNTSITIVQRKGYVWTGTESLLTSNVIQARFLREHEAELPDMYYYGGINSFVPIVAGDLSVNVPYGNWHSNTITLNLVSGGPIVSVGVGPILPQHGTATGVGRQLSYTPSALWEGTETFNYYVRDIAGNVSYANITISTAKIVAGRISGVILYGERLVTINLRLEAGGPIVNAYLGTGDELPLGGSVSINNSSTTYALLPDFYDIDMYVYYVEDAAGNVSSSTVFVDVVPEDTTPLPPIVAGPVTEEVYYNSINNLIDPNPVVYYAPGVWQSVSLSTVVSIGLVSPATHGVATIEGKKISYTPTVGWVGVDTFTYSMIDVVSGNTSTSLVSITTRIITASPIQETIAANSIDNVIKPSPVFFDLDAWDTPSIASGPTIGTAIISGLLILYTPAIGWVGTEEFTYTIQDLAGNVSPPATVTVTVE